MTALNSNAYGPDTAERARGDLQVVVRVAALLRLFTPARPDIGLTQALAGLGMQKSTAHRYLRSLENHGFLRRIEGARYALGPLVDQLGALTTTRWRVMEAAEPVMNELAATCRQTAVLSMWGGQKSVIVRVIEDDSQVVHISVRIGSTLPLDSAQGRMFLAHMTESKIAENLMVTMPTDQAAAFREKLAEARDTGITSDEHVVAGVRAMAVPVFGSDGRITAVMAVVGTLNSVPADTGSGMAQALMAAAKLLGARLAAGEAITTKRKARSIDV